MNRQTMSAEDRAAATARAEAMVRMLEEGETLQQIGDHYGISREAVRIYVNKYSVRSVPQIIAETKERRLAKLRQDVLEWSESNPGAPVDDAVHKFQISRAKVHAILGPRKALHTQAKQSANQRWTDDELLDQVRSFNADTGRTTRDDFEMWSSAQDGPSSMTIILRFSRWNNALTLAGVRDAEPIKHRAVYADDDLWAAVAEFLSSSPERYTFRAFEEWAKGIPGVPSGALVRFRIGRWAEVVNTILIARCNDGSQEWLVEIDRRRDWSSFIQSEDQVQHVRDAIEALGVSTLTVAGYNDWAQENGRPCPSALTKKSGMTWSQMVGAAGGSPWSPKDPRLSLKELESDIGRFFARYPQGKSTDYLRWHAGEGKGAAALMTIVYRLGDGSWNNVEMRYGARKAEG